jgi:hypothetical protein
MRPRIALLLQLAVLLLALSPDGLLVCSSLGKQSVTLWDVAGDKPRLVRTPTDYEGIISRDCSFLQTAIVHDDPARPLFDEAARVAP